MLGPKNTSAVGALIPRFAYHPYPLCLLGWGDPIKRHVDLQSNRSVPQDSTLETMPCNEIPCQLDPEGRPAAGRNLLLLSVKAASCSGAPTPRCARLAGIASSRCGLPGQTARCPVDRCFGKRTPVNFALTSKPERAREGNIPPSRSAQCARAFASAAERF